MTERSMVIGENRSVVGAGELAALPAETLWLQNFLSAQTRETYKKALEGFIEFAGIDSLEALRDVSQAHVLAWREQMLLKGQAPRTINNRISALSSLFKELADKQLISENPASGVRRPRVNNARVESIVLTQKQARTLLDAPDLSTLKGLRDSAYLHILLYTGCRISESRTLRIGDFFEDAGYFVLELTTKGGKRHRVPINQEVQIAIRRYLSRSTHDGDPEAPLLQPAKRSGKPNRNGHRDFLGRDQLTKLFKAYAVTSCPRIGLTPDNIPRSVGISQRTSPCRFRDASAKR